MTISAVIFFRDGQPLSVDEGCKDFGAERVPEDVVWISMSDPTPNDLRIVRDRYGLSMPSYLLFFSAGRRPLVDSCDRFWLVEIPAVGISGQAGVSVLVGRSYVVTVDHGGSSISRRLDPRLRDASRVSGFTALHVAREVLALAIADYDAAIEAHERKVIAFGHDTLSDVMKDPTSEPAVKLRASLVAIIHTLEQLVEVGRDFEPLVGAQPVFACPALLDDVLDRTRISARRGDAVLRVLEAANACRECKVTRDKGRCRAALMAGLLLSIAIIFIGRVLAGIFTSRPITLLLALTIFAARLCLTLCGAVLLFRFLKIRFRT